MSSELLPIAVDDLRFAYGARPALQGLSFYVQQGEIFGLLGPNGGGKSTLFRLLSTLLPVQSGTVKILGWDLTRDAAIIRQHLGITFQSPSLDRKLTVWENLKHQGHLYGLSGSELRNRIEAVLDRLRVRDRQRDLVGTLSGGLQRRVEIAKSLLHRPRVLLLDEPSTGLDPGARLDLWQFLRDIRQELGMTMVVTTHLLDEAEDCDRLGVIHQGQMVALDTPAALRASVGGDSLTIRTSDPEQLASALQAHWPLQIHRLGDQLRFEHPRGHELVPQLMEQFGNQITAVTLGKPTLEDVFIQRTGQQFW